MGPSSIEMVMKGSEKVKLQFWVVLMVQTTCQPFWRVLINREVQNVTDLLRVHWCPETHIGFWWFISGQVQSFMILMKHQEDNYIPQTVINYLNPSDPSRPLQSGTIPQDVIVPGTSQEQQQYSNFLWAASGALINISILLRPIRMQQHPSVQ